MRDPSAVATLDVLDEQLVHAAGELVRGRLQLVDRLGPAVNAAYAALADDGRPVAETYEAEWAPEPLRIADTGDVDELLRAALEARRRAEIERGVTLVGPHRDDWKLTIEGLDARTQASQGEQRSLALALRLAGRGVVHELTGTPPVLLLDDVFSELDARRSSALVRNLPPGQTLLTTAGSIPPDVKADQVLRISAGRIDSRRSMKRSDRSADEPVPLRDAVAAVGRELGMPRSRRHFDAVGGVAADRRRAARAAHRSAFGS